MKSFVIMPFSDTSHLNKVGDKVTITSKQWTFIFNDWIKKAVECYPKETIECNRSSAAPGNFVKGIIKDIYSSDLVIADLTGQKPNVYYELGIRHSLKLGTIMITQDIKALPSDLTSYYCFGYEYTNEAHLLDEYFVAFKKELHEKIDHVLTNKVVADNPVADFLELKHYYQALEKEKQIELFKHLLNDIIEELKRIFLIFKETIKQKAYYLEKNSICFIFFDLAIFDSIYIRLTTSDFSEMKSDMINEFTKIIKELRMVFLNIYQYWESARNHVNNENTIELFSQLESSLTREETILHIFNQLKDFNNY